MELTNIDENVLELIGIQSITDAGIDNVIDIQVEDDESFILANGIISHNSARGSILQRRNAESDGVYTLKGKIKNARNIGDLSKNNEIIDIMAILGIDPANYSNCAYNKVVIATDWDCLHKDTVIKTLNGNKKISELNYDDKVLSHDGNYHEIVKIIEAYKDSYVQISINGETIICGKTHRFMIVRDGKVIEELAMNIRKTDFFLIKNLNTVYRNMKIDQINLKDYNLVQADEISFHESEPEIFYDIEVNETKTFYIVQNGTLVLSHNCDGLGHIASLVINLFYKWFPDVIEQGKLFILITPLVAAEVGGKTVYFFSIQEHIDFETKNNVKCKNVRYLKGLGSLELSDWEWVMAQRRMFKIYNDKSSKRFMEVAFGTSAQKRKNWLQSAE